MFVSIKLDCLLLLHCSIDLNLFQNGLKLIMETSKCINAFPSGVTRSLYSAIPAFNKIVDDQSEKILQVVSTVLKHQHIKGNFQR